MARPSKASLEAIKTIFYIRKDTMKEYSLMRMILKGPEVQSDEVVHRDIPAIIYGKLYQMLKGQDIGNG